MTCSRAAACVTSGSTSWSTVPVSRRRRCTGTSLPKTTCRRLSGATRAALDPGLGRGRGQTPRQHPRGAAAGDLRPVRRVVSPRGLRGLLVHQRAARARSYSPRRQSEHRAPGEHPLGRSPARRGSELERRRLVRPLLAHPDERLDRLSRRGRPRRGTTSQSDGPATDRGPQSSSSSDRRSRLSHTQTRPSTVQRRRSRPGTLGGGGGGQPPPSLRPPRVGPAVRDQGGTHQVLSGRLTVWLTTTAYRRHRGCPGRCRSLTAVRM